MNRRYPLSLGESLKLAEQAAAAPHTLGLTPVEPKRKRQPPTYPLIAPAVRFGAGWVELDVPLRAVNRGNVREAHWGARAKANATAAEILGNMLCTVPVPVRKTLDGPARVTLTRVAPRGLDRHDNLRQALKVYPDALSVWLRSGYMGRHDGDADLEWIYCENRDGNRYGVRVRIEAKA